MPGSCCTQFKLCLLAAALSCLMLLAACKGPSPANQTPQNTANPALTTAPSRTIAENAVGLEAELTGLKTGASFSVNVAINTSKMVRGAQWSLQFDPSLMKCEAFQEGAFLKDWAAANNGSTLVFPKPKIDNASGRISDTGIAVMSQSAGGATGRGVLGTYTFTALRDSLQMPRLVNVRAADEKGNMYEIEVDQ